MNDPLGDRIKNNYEDRTRYMLPRRTYTIIRLDGKAFHTYTKGLEKPFDLGLIEDFDKAVLNIMPQIQGAQCAYVQSDEISILVTDFEKENTSAWFDGNVQKIVSVSASLMTAEFNFLRTRRCNPYIESCDTKPHGNDLAFFDARVFTIPDWIEVYNYFVWRNNDCSRNSLRMMAQSLYSHKELDGQTCSQMSAMIYDKGVDWENYDMGLKNGRLIYKEEYIEPDNSELAKIVKGKSLILNPVVRRTRWAIKSAPIFTKEPNVIKQLIPKYI
jgi:tRNA(His) guanylyltransferase